MEKGTLQHGINIIPLRDYLGHYSVKTRHIIYAKEDSKLKREALEKAYRNLSPKEQFDNNKWAKNKDLLSWLDSYKQ